MTRKYYYHLPNQKSHISTLKQVSKVTIPLLLPLLDFLKLQSGFESHEKKDLLALLLQPVRMPNTENYTIIYKSTIKPSM